MTTEWIRPLGLSLLIAVAGCSNLDTQQQRALSGGAMGAGAGAAVGLLTGSPFLGTVVGGAAGAAIGAFTSERDVKVGSGAGGTK